MVRVPRCRDIRRVAPVANHPRSESRCPILSAFGRAPEDFLLHLPGQTKTISQEVIRISAIIRGKSGDGDHRPNRRSLISIVAVRDNLAALSPKRIKSKEFSN
jgi:hypothetical protein